MARKIRRVTVIGGRVRFQSVNTTWKNFGKTSFFSGPLEVTGVYRWRGRIFFVLLSIRVRIQTGSFPKSVFARQQTCCFQIRPVPAKCTYPIWKGELRKRLMNCWRAKKMFANKKVSYNVFPSGDSFSLHS